MTEPRWTDSRLRAQVPEGWSVKESWTLGSPDGQATVVVSREPLPPVVTTEQYARGLGDRLGAEYPQYQQHVLTVLPLASGSAYARLFSWAPPGGGRVAQVQVYATTPGTGFTATATAPAATFEYLADLLDGIVRSLEFDGAPARPVRSGAPVERPAAAAAPVEQPAPVGQPAAVAAPVELRKPEPEAADPESEPQPEPEPVGPEIVEQEPAPPQPTEPEPEAAEEPPPASGSGSTSATVLVQLPRLPPGPPPPPRPS